MKLDTFIDNLDRYGGDLDDWPEALRAAARQLAASSPEAAAAAGRARQLADVLAGLPERAAPPALAARIAARAATDRSLLSTVGDWFARALWRPALAASVPLALGFALGFSYQQPATTDDAYLLESFGMLPFSSSFEELPYEE
ncbi:MAG: hypothetical protein AB7I04_09385 [Pseudomonadales bacterium]